jgi:hypothetical protein
VVSVPGDGREGSPRLTVLVYRLAILVYRLAMPGKKRPSPEDADIFEVLSELAPLHPRNDMFPGEVFLYLAADALEWCGASRAAAPGGTA